MTRQEAVNIAKKLHETHPPGFEFNELKRIEVPVGEGETGYQWRAEWVNWGPDPAEVIIERWPDIYTEADPEPGEDEPETETETTETTDSEDGSPASV